MSQGGERGVLVGCDCCDTAIYFGGDSRRSFPYWKVESVTIAERGMNRERRRRFGESGYKVTMRYRNTKLRARD